MRTKDLPLWFEILDQNMAYRYNNKIESNFIIINPKTVNSIRKFMKDSSYKFIISSTNRICGLLIYESENMPVHDFEIG